jgi:autotransporter-associated beta strand protein
MVTNSAATSATLTVNNATSAYTYDAAIAGNLALIKTGTNPLTLSGTNTYTGSTVVSNGTLLMSGSMAGPGAVEVRTGATLGGNGTIGGPVNVEIGGNLAPGLTSIGTLSVTTNLTLASGSQTLVEIDAALGSSDLVTGLTNITYGGTLVVSNVSLTVVTNNQTFTLFSALSSTGDFSSISPTGPTSSLVWKFNPTNGVLTAVSGIADYSTNLSFSLSGGNLTVTWPDTHLGWYLQSQTNAINVGLSNNWTDVLGSETNTSITIPVNALDPAVFFRMVHTNQ